MNLMVNTRTGEYHCINVCKHKLLMYNYEKYELVITGYNSEGQYFHLEPVAIRPVVYLLSPYTPMLLLYGHISVKRQRTFGKN
jgi:hypothetical protein